MIYFPIIKFFKRNFMPSLLEKMSEQPLAASILLTSLTVAFAVFSGGAVAEAKQAYDTRSRCYLVAYQRVGKPMVSPTEPLNNSTLCVPGAPGSRQVVDAIQAQLRTEELGLKNPAPVVILNILLAEENENGKRNRT
jgi:hypothetical protein